MGQNKDLFCYRKNKSFRQCAWGPRQLVLKPGFRPKGRALGILEKSEKFNSLRPILFELCKKNYLNRWYSIFLLDKTSKLRQFYFLYHCFMMLQHTLYVQHVLYVMYVQYTLVGWCYCTVVLYTTTQGLVCTWVGLWRFNSILLQVRYSICSRYKE